MLLLAFDPDSIGEPSEKQAAELAETSEMNLRYGYFGTRVSIAAAGFQPDELRVPLLDFAHCVLLAARAVSDGQPGRIGFTDSSMLIEFVPAGGELAVLRSWDPVPGSCVTAEFLESAYRFSVDALRSIAERYPAFRKNAYHGVLGGMIEAIDRAER
ncbi:hypothetical protein [Streptomyces exfoliatus]|uniref:hypothetical protein n=1 Tax=Streptomyces exfoliatus TaxID=1905 RepID=UPI0004C7597C|nr:hypothetical protein [Streptomyces exfoliatus]